jgi:tetratricopeptide (TPR) repeat protein
LSVKKIVHRKEKLLDHFKMFLFFALLFLTSIDSFSQDSIRAAKDFTEENELKFQEFFFEALSQKSIGNHQKAIDNLESCNQIVPNDMAVFFEFSKNYLALNKTFLAKEYIQRAIEKEVTNIWMQKHLVKVFVKENNFLDAIKIQQKIVALNSKERAALIRLHLQNSDYESALNVMNTLESEHLLPSKFKEIKDRLTQKKTSKLRETVTSEDVFKKFETDKSYTVLKQVLEASRGQLDALLKYSAEGIARFPAQPFVYLMKGRALNTKKEYNLALEILKSGLDFVFESEMEANFYKEISLSYRGLGNKLAAEKYREKEKKLKN